MRKSATADMRGSRLEAHGAQRWQTPSFETAALRPPQDEARARTIEPASLLRGAQKLRRAGAELQKQRLFVRLRALQMPQLDVAETADFLRDCRDADGEMMIFGRELLQQFS